MFLEALEGINIDQSTKKIFEFSGLCLKHDPIHKIKGHLLVITYI